MEINYKVFTYFIIVTGMFCKAFACVNDEDCLYKSLFAEYNRNVRPLINSSETLDVRVSMVVNSLLDIKERDQMMLTVGFFRVKWIDEFLSWNRDKWGGVEKLIITADQVWLPDIAISNSASKFYDITYKRDFHVRITSDGQVAWSFGGIFSSNCNIDLKKYPFDTQSCHIELENWMYSEKDVNLSFARDENEVNISQLGANAVWFFDGWEVKRNIKYNDYASLRFTLTWKRKTLYYYVNIVIPIVLMLLVALGVFWLPAECGEKMSLAITIVLAFSVFQIIIMENTPVNSDVVPEITELVMLVMALATTSLLTSMLVVYISGKSSKKRAPAWLRTICFKCLARVLCMNKDVPVASDDVLECLEHSTTVANRACENNLRNGKLENDYVNTNDVGKFKTDPYLTMNSLPEEALDYLQNGSRYTQSSRYFTERQNKDKELKSISSYLSKIKDIMEEKDLSDFIRSEWRYIATIIDRMAFWITLSIMITCLILIVL